jgi:hypothetical protein
MEKVKKMEVQKYKLRSGKIVEISTPPLMRFFAHFSKGNSSLPSSDGTEFVDLADTYVSLESHAHAFEEALKRVKK